MSSHRDPEPAPRGRRWPKIIEATATGAADLEAPSRTTWLQPGLVALDTPHPNLPLLPAPALLF